MQMITPIFVSLGILTAASAASASDTLQLRLAVTSVMAAGMANDGYSDFSQVDGRVKQEKENPVLKPFAPRLVPTQVKDVLGFKLVLIEVGNGDCETLAHASRWLDDISRVIVNGRDTTNGSPDCRAHSVVEIHYR